MKFPLLALLLVPALLGAPRASESPGAPVMSPNLEGNIARPLRYQPDHGDFVILNGSQSFNRSLYGGGTAFRLEAGDRPEFALYLPGRGGVLRLGIHTADTTFLLRDAARILARYRAGSMVYEISDPRLGPARLTLTILAPLDSESLLLRLDSEGAASSFDLVWAFGGLSGQRGRRDADIGTETAPLNEWFRLRPEHCTGNTLLFSGQSFLLSGKTGRILGVCAPGSSLRLGSAQNWDKPEALLNPAQPGDTSPLLVGSAPLTPGDSSLFLALQRLPQASDDSGELATYLEVRKDNDKAPAAPASGGSAVKPLTYADLPALFARTEATRQALASHLSVETPDDYLNAAVRALNVAGDGVWDTPTGTVMHGAVAWRSKLLGWRGPYLNDALGRHDRAASHINYWAGRQNTSPIPEKLPAPEASANLSRNETALHSNGDLSNSHYDMNLVYIDAVFRHLMWTGDLGLARRLWPMIQRHLAWEKRLFRRPFGEEKLPLYEAYCCIWASDDLYYNGGGVTHSSAYNYYHNLLAARLASRLGENPAPYQQEADLIARGMQRELWLPKQGIFAEWRDALGYKLPHTSPALWTFYHTTDSLAATPLEAWQMSRFIDTQLAHFPLKGENVPNEGCYVLPTTNWLPYAWSTNNVVASEVAHTALAFWQSNRADEAWKLYKGALLDTMFSGLCPGNAGMCTGFDVARREAQRDFADSVGMLSRALVEGLFGISPDLITGELLVQPGLPESWQQASLNHTSLNFSFRREGNADTYVVEQRFQKMVPLRLRLPARSVTIAQVLANGLPASWSCVEDAVGRPLIEILLPASNRQEITIGWTDSTPALPNTALGAVQAIGDRLALSFPQAEVVDLRDPQSCLSSPAFHGSSVTAVAADNPGHHVFFARLKQGSLLWWQPVCLELRPRYELLPSAEQVPGSLGFRIRNNTTYALADRVSLAWGDQTAELDLDLPAGASSAEFRQPAGMLPPGSHVVRLTGVKSHLQLASAIVTNWCTAVLPDKALPEPVRLDALLKQRITELFKDNYLSPRPQSCSLSVPKQGFGSWCKPTHHFEIDDTGLRNTARAGAGSIVMPNGIPFTTPGNATAPNIALTSLWDQHPHRLDVPLTGKASHLYLLMAGTSTSMQSRFEGARVLVRYKDGHNEVLPLRNPESWWPIDRDYFTDDFAFSYAGQIPPRLDLRTGVFRLHTPESFKGRGAEIKGGAATVLDLPLDPQRELAGFSIIPLANEALYGLMAATLLR